MSTVVHPHRYQQILGRVGSRAELRRAVRGGHLTMPTRGVYLEQTDAPAAHQLLAALLLRMPPTARYCLSTAAGLHGFSAPDDGRLHAVVPAGVTVPQIAGLKVHTSVLPLGPPTLIDGLPCVRATRCAAELARLCPRRPALAVLDSFLRAGLGTRDDLRAEALGHARLRGVRQALDLIGRADPRAECPQESMLRLIAIDAGLPAPVPQLAIVDDANRERYVLDLGWRDRKAGAEYDGRSHLDHGALRHDRERHNWLAARGWRLRHFTGVDVYRRPHHVAGVLTDLLAA